MRSSSSLSNCRVEWRPSRVLAGSLLMLGLGAAISLVLSAAPWFLALPAGSLALAHGLALARRELRRPAMVLDWSGGTGELLLEHEGHRESWRDARAAFRGGLVTVAGIDGSGRRQQLHWWPDTLRPDARRRFRLASGTSRTR